MRAWPATSITMLLVLSACTIQQQVHPVSVSASQAREICVVETTSVREHFLDAYSNALTDKGLKVRVLPEGSPLNTCPLTSTYAAKWQWDLALYLSYASLKVYRNGHLDGEALYDGTGAGLNANKFIKAEAKVRELTDQLFPN